MIKINVAQANNDVKQIEVPTDISLSLMEVLKACEYPVQATCGGMALCATCHVEVLEGERFKQATDTELDILESLPEFSTCSRLSCQMRIDDEMDGILVKLRTEES